MQLWSLIVRCRQLAIILTASLLHPYTSKAQRPPEQPNAAEILHKMQKLNVLGSVLYIVAHPDDENTRLIAWLANGKKVRTGNLSLTRGDGGQNLIGPELGDALGIIRTQELMEARRIDGGEQFFTRAVDFGYSKSADESFEKWGKQEVLSDVVRVIRMFRPDVIITRFAPDRSAGHGHHEASAILAEEAFDMAGDPKAFPEQLQQGLEVWQPHRLFFNGSTWWKKDLTNIAKNDPDWFTVDVGGYDPLLGMSYTEIAGRSRSMHKSQGFGAAETRGEMLEYLKFIKGDRPKTKDIFEGIDMTWGRVPKSDGIASGVDELIKHHSPSDPSASIARLVALLTEINSCLGVAFLSGENYFLIKKQEEISDLVLASAGTTFEVLSQNQYLAQGGTADLKLALLERNGRPLDVSVRMLPNQRPTAFMKIGERIQLDTTVTIPAPKLIDQPYWLAKPHTNLYDVIDWDIGKPRLSTTLPTELFLDRTKENARERSILVTSEALFRWVDRVDGERIRPVYITPVASIIPKTEIVIARGGTQAVEIEVETLTDSLSGQLNVTLPNGWATTKDIKRVNISKRNERQSFTFQLIPGENAQAGAVKFEFVGPKGTADRTLHEIDYPHIMAQVYYTPAEVNLIPLDVKVNATRIGYINGADDDVPQAIERLGVAVDMIDPSSATLESISKYEAIVVGIRAYNTEKAMARFNPTLMKFAENGGTVVVQYNTRSSDMMVLDSLIGPYPFKLSRDRVTVEEAPPTFLDPKHPLLNTPNKITLSDFDGWVQERGLYFVGERDPKYTPLISWNDPGEEPLDGALITCEYGKGRYVYTGISFFRELPAGVGGAYRLFANLISRRDAK